MFNVYLPKLLEGRIPSASDNKDLERTMWDIVIFTLGGCPGALVGDTPPKAKLKLTDYKLGAWLQELPLGRRISLALSTIVTALQCWLFVIVKSETAIRITTVGISLSASTMWAILYGWTPAIFSTNGRSCNSQGCKHFTIISVRGTACGSASAFSRM
jgi:hypothetical protein